MKQKILNISLILVALAIVIITIIGLKTKSDNKKVLEVTDDSEMANLDEMVFESNPKVSVDFSDVLIGQKEEMRKLIVLEQEATVSAELNSKIIKILNIKAFEKSQTVTYTGMGRFLVDLDNFDEDSIVDDSENKILTIKIGHAYLESVEIDPYKIQANDVEEGFFARGDITLSVEDFNSIEKSIKTKMEEKLKTAENGQKADEVALRMVKATYEPVVLAIDSEYEVRVVFE